MKRCRSLRGRASPSFSKRYNFVDLEGPQGRPDTLNPDLLVHHSSVPFFLVSSPAPSVTVVMTTPEYLTGNKEAISKFIDKFDVGPALISSPMYRSTPSLPS